MWAVGMQRDICPLADRVGGSGSIEGTVDLPGDKHNVSTLPLINTASILEIFCLLQRYQSG